MAGFFDKIFRRKKISPVANEPAPVERQPENKPSDSAGTPWIGVDLDGTLARDGTWRGFDHIGRPVPLMMARVKHWLEQGLTVKILTARAVRPEAIEPIKKWLVANGLPELEITNAKDFDMIEMWDDRAVQVVQNTGRPFLSPSVFGRPRSPILPDEAANQTFYMLPAKPVESVEQKTVEKTTPSDGTAAK